MADPLERAEWPREFVGSLRPSKATSDKDLKEALAEVETSLRGGQAGETLVSPLHRPLVASVLAARGRLGTAFNTRALLPGTIGGFADRIERVPTPAPEPAPREPVTALASLRNLPLAIPGSPLTAEWARGQAPSRSHGPFLNQRDEPIWIDIFRPVKLVSLLWSQNPLLPPRPMALLPMRSTAVPARGGLRLAAGSAWLPASLLVPGRPANEFIGVKIKGGTLSLSGRSQSQAQSITMSGVWKAGLQLNLDVPEAGGATFGASAGGNKTGADAKNAQIGLPGNLGLEFGSGGLTALALADSSLKAYGNSATLKRSDAAAFHDAVTHSIVIPCTISLERFAFAEQQSSLFQCGKAAPVLQAGWSVVTTVTTPDNLGQASGAGTLWLSLGSGLRAKWNAQPGAVALAKPKLQLAPASIAITTEISTDPVVQEFPLWDEPSTERRSSVTFEAPAGTTLYYLTSPQLEALLIFGKAVAHVDRPVAADGARIAVAMPGAILALVETPAATNAYLLGADALAIQQPPFAMALENLLLNLQPPASLWLAGPLSEAGIASGTLNLRFQTRFMLPTLPDPYAASFEASGSTSDAPIGWLTASVIWPDPANPRLDFAIEFNGQTAPDGKGGALPALDSEAQSLFMLDLSSNADQFGVALPFNSLGQFSVDGLSLVAPAGRIGIFTLPPISWEPMLSKQPAPNLDAILPPPPHDGGPALLAADSVTLVPVAPMPLLTEYLDAVNQKKVFEARLPLPFGIVARLDTRPGIGASGPSTFLADGGQFKLNQPNFPSDLSGSRQLLMQAPDSKILGRERYFPQPSYTQLEDTNGYSAGVLSQNIHDRWLGDFGYGKKGAPLERYELTGYGASLFSDWRDRLVLGPAITQARFDVMVGRTAHEVIQMESRAYPWCAKVVRIITIQRTNGGWVLREDSGWLPASHGLFQFPKGADIPANTYVPPVLPAFTDSQIHRGAVRGVMNIRNIRLSAGQFAAGGITFQPVKFDADVLIDPAVKVIAGGTQIADGTLVPSREIDGYIQITGTTYTGTINGVADPFALPVDRGQLFQLLLAKGPAVAPLSCTVAVGGLANNATLTQRGVQAAVSCNDDPTDPQLVAALRGTPILPRDGAWSLARMKSTDAAPNALDPHFAAPLVRPTAPAAGSDKWHLADPADIRRLGDADTPQVIYGLLQSAGTQKMFFARPQAINGVSQIKVPKPPSFADVAALFNAAGIFPNLGDAFDFAGLSGIDVNAGDIGFDKQFAVARVGGKPRETMLMDLGIVQIVLRYCDEKLNDPGSETIVAMKVTPTQSPRWSISLKRVGFAVKYKSNDLIRMYAEVKADEKSAATFTNLNVNYVGFLEILQGIFANVQQLARFLPGGAGAGLKVGFSQGRLTVRNEFALPNLPLGTGQITDVAVAMGIALQLSPLSIEFVAGLGSSEKPFRWIVSPLAGTGVIQVGVNNEGLNILIQGGIGLGLAIDLGIASGSASITLAAELNTAVDPFMLKAILSGRASVDVLRGLASATITLAAGLGIIPPNNLLDLPVPPNFPSQLGPYTIGFVASVSVGIHISICWVINIDWDDYWQFRQDITTPAVPLPF